MRPGACGLMRVRVQVSMSQSPSAIDPGLGTALLYPAAFTGAAAVLTWAITSPDSRILIALGAVLLGLLLCVRADVLYFATVGLFFVNPSLLPTLATLGTFKVRIADPLFVLLLLRVAVHVASRRVPFRLPRICYPMAALLALIGAGIAVLAFRRPDIAPASLASYLRLIETFALLPVSYLLFRTSAPFSGSAVFFYLIALLSVLAGAVQWWLDATGNWRAEGVLGVNSLGLVSTLLVLAAACSPGRRLRWLAFLAGLSGLAMTKSASSIIATTVCLAVSLAGRRFTARTMLLVALVPIVIAAGLLLVRYDDAEGVLDLSGGSFAHRLYLANVALRVFMEHPIAGVGWHASTSAEVVGEARLNADLRERYRRLPNYLFADVSPTSVHNMYLHLLVELGALGGALVLAIGIRLRREAKRAAIAASLAPWSKPYARFLTLALLAIAIWWNSNPLYPGQIETVLFMVFAGLLASLAEGFGEAEGTVL